MTNQSKHINKGSRPIILPSLSQRERSLFISGAKLGFDIWRLKHLLKFHIIPKFSNWLPIAAAALRHSVSDPPIFKFACVATFHQTPSSTGTSHG